MKKRNIIVLVILILLLSTNKVNALTKSEMTKLNLTKVSSYSKPTNYTSVQGGTVTDKYVITLFLDNSKNNQGKNALLVLDKNTYKKVNLSSNPIKDYCFGHANDATYNSKTNELLILNGSKVHILDAHTFKQKRVVTLTRSYHAIGYDSSSNQYVLAASGSNHKTIFYIMDSKFNIKSNFSMTTNLTKQGLTVHNGYIYYTCYEAGKVTKYQSVYDGVLKAKENAIYVYDLKGNKKTIYYIPYSYNNEVFSEIENISFNGNKMLIQFNQSGKVGYYTPVINNDTEETLTINLTNNNLTTTDNSYEITISSNNKVISKVKNKSNKFTYTIKYTKTGTYTYKIKQSSMNNSNIEYDTSEKEITVKVTYDPTTNKLKATSNKVTFTNTKKEQTTTTTTTENTTPSNDTTTDNATNTTTTVTIENTTFDNETKEEVEETTPDNTDNVVEDTNNTEETTTGDNNIIMQVVDVPDTSNSNLYYLAGISIIMSVLVYIKYKKA
jgi:pilin isopeptide linkage protein